MLSRSLAIGVLLVTASTSLIAQESRLARLEGRIMADNRPVDWVIEVRFDSETGGTVDTAYTLSGEDFEFTNVPINYNDVYYLVVDEPGFMPFRERVYFNRDPLGRGLRYAGGTKMIFLDRIPSEAEPEEETGETVDLRQLLAEVPEEARLAYEGGVEQIENGNRDDAVELLEQAVELAPEYYEALTALGTEYLRNQRYDQAEEMLLRATGLNQNDPIPLTNLGTMHFQIGQTLEASPSAGEIQTEIDEAYNDAAELLDRAFRLDPASPRVTYYLGSALYKTGEYERAEALLLEAIGRDSDLPEARITLINLYVRQDRNEAAINQIDAFLAGNPDTARRAALQEIRESLEARLTEPSPAAGPTSNP